ncbi:MAG: hypothetical protein JWO08_1398 [Verrucomicrobiaceae bacterium]|nr:hypothetical protein [Verrucomicrobiaceae bacterium]
MKPTGHLLQTPEDWKASGEFFHSLECQHTELALTRRTVANGTVAIVSQCQCCGRQKGSALRKLPEHDSLPAFNETLEREWSKQREQHVTQFKKKRQRENTLKWFSDYNRYLQSPLWKEKRDLVLQPEDFVCQGCRKARATSAHHTTYRHQGHEFLFELIALCQSCHDRYHASFVDALLPSEEPYFDGQSSGNFE